MDNKEISKKIFSYYKTNVSNNNSSNLNVINLYKMKEEYFHCINNMEAIEKNHDQEKNEDLFRAYVQKVCDQKNTKWIKNILLFWIQKKQKNK